MESKTFSGKVFIVTGGTQGLGEHIARHLARNGARGLVICGRNVERGQMVAGEIEQQLGCPCLFVQADLKEESECRAVVQACDQKFGSVFGLINAAGTTDRGTFEGTTVELWDYIFAVNARAPFILAQESVKIMKREKNGGSIVNVSSNTSHGGPPFITAYCAAKAALNAFTKNIAHSLLQDRIRANALNIGWMDTPNEHKVQQAMGKGPDWLEQASASQPFKRLLHPKDVAGLTAFLLSRDGEMMTGSVIDFDQTVIGTWD